MTYLYAVNIELNDSECEMSRFLPIVSPERLVKIEKIAKREDKVRCLLGEVLLRYILWKHYEIGQSKITFKYNQHGKPSLVSSQQVHFNITHSGKWVLCGVDEQPIGVDVEKQLVAPLPIAKRFFAEEEYLHMVRQSPAEQIETFAKIWTLKENYHLGADIQSKVLAFAFSLASEIERQLISERTKNSLQRLKDEGKKLGRPYGFSYQKLSKKHNKIKELLEKNVTKAEIARLMGCTWLTIHRYIKNKIDIYPQIPKQ